MPRKVKTTVDYFPHKCTGGKTMFIIESQFGNDGYAAWFKLLELLGVSNCHYYDCRNTEAMEYMLAKMRLLETQCVQILDKLAKLGAIDIHFWKNRVIFSENFITNLDDLYDRRKYKCPHKKDLYIQLFGFSYPNDSNNGVDADIKPQIKRKEKKVNKKESVREKNTPAPIFEKSKLIKKVCDEMWDDEKLINEQAQKYSRTPDEIKKEINYYAKQRTAKENGVIPTNEAIRTDFKLWLSNPLAFSRK